jgi:CheY-like chemotaxis protein
MTDEGENKILQALVVDDDETIRELLKLRLGSMGYEVTTAGDGLTALNLCIGTMFEVVICDVRMPRLSGISFLRNYKQKAPNSLTRIIMMSSLTDASIRADAASAGAIAFLEKPISFPSLIKAVRGEE